jgi:hypothetical protein
MKMVVLSGTLFLAAELSAAPGALPGAIAGESGSCPARVDMDRSPELTPCWQLVEPPRGDLTDLMRLELDGPLRHWRDGYVTGRSGAEARSGGLSPDWRHQLEVYCAENPNRTYADAVAYVYENFWVD